MSDVVAIVLAVIMVVLAATLYLYLTRSTPVRAVRWLSEADAADFRAGEPFLIETLRLLAGRRSSPVTALKFSPMGTRPSHASSKTCARRRRSSPGRCSGSAPDALPTSYWPSSPSAHAAVSVSSAAVNHFYRLTSWLPILIPGVTILGATLVGTPTFAPLGLVVTALILSGLYGA